MGLGCCGKGRERGARGREGQEEPPPPPPPFPRTVERSSQPGNWSGGWAPMLHPREMQERAVPPPRSPSHTYTLAGQGQGQGGQVPRPLLGAGVGGGAGGNAAPWPRPAGTWGHEYLEIGAAVLREVGEPWEGLRHGQRGRRVPGGMLFMCSTYTRAHK